MMCLCYNDHLMAELPHPDHHQMPTDSWAKGISVHILVKSVQLFKKYVATISQICLKTIPPSNLIGRGET